MSKRKSIDIFDYDDDSDCESENEDACDQIFIPNNDENSDVEGLNSDEDENGKIEKNNEFCEWNNTKSRNKKLLSNRKYKWIDGEKVYDPLPTEEIFNINEIRKKTCDKNPVELF